jgi:hypothetical protein
MDDGGEKDRSEGGMLDGIKLKHVWVFTAIILGYIVYQQGWPSPAIEKLMVDGAQVWMGALIGFGIDSVHFGRWKPSSNDPTPFNQARRTGLIIAGMVAFSL